MKQVKSRYQSKNNTQSAIQVQQRGGVNCRNALTRRQSCSTEKESNSN